MTGMTPAAATRPAHAVRGLVAACHPAPTAAVTLVAVILASGVGLGGGRVVLLGAAVLTGQLSIGWSNDRIDAARDRVAGRRDKPTATGRVPADVVAVAAGVALLATIALSVPLGPRPAIALLLLVAAGWAYNLGLKGTVLSGATYLVGFGALPAAPYLARPEQSWPPWWVPVVGALLGFAAHFANVLPDLRADAATGVRGLPQRLGARVGVVVMAAALAVASVVLGVGRDHASTTFTLVASAVGIVGGSLVAVVAVRRPDSPTAFRITMVLALLDVVLVIALST